MKKSKHTIRLFSFVISFSMLLTLFSGMANAASTDTGMLHLRSSGNLNTEKLTKDGIVQLLNKNPLTLPDDLFETIPSCTAPYTTGTVNTEALQAATNRLNALRYIAGVPAVSLNLGLCENAQYGAVILAAQGGLSHRPSKPEDMDNNFYQKAYQATSSSNLYAGMTLTTAVDGFMDDSDAGNVDRIGHRRWQLNPTMGKVGFGYAESNTGYKRYVTEKVFDKSGAGCNYDFISWPASGCFPSNLEFFQEETAWSVTLNPAKFQTPNQNNITITLTRESDGKSWIFSGNDYIPSSSDIYFHVDTESYGVSNCIIFRPDGINAYDGIYTVHIDGLKTKSGQKVTDFTYQVEFFNAETYATPKEPELPNNPFVDVSTDAWYYDAVKWAIAQKITNGTSQNTFSPDDKCTRAQILTFMYRYLKEPAFMFEHNYPFSDVADASPYEDPINWAVRQRIANAQDKTRFGADDFCTRAEAVLFLYKMDGSSDVEISSAFHDVPPDAEYAKAVSWAVAQKITEGTSKYTFSPDETCTRAQIVTFLNRMAKNVYHTVDATSVKPHAHNYSWYVSALPTFSSDGHQHFHCNICQDEFDHILPSWSSIPFAEG